MTIIFVIGIFYTLLLTLFILLLYVSFYNNKINISVKHFVTNFNICYSVNSSNIKFFIFKNSFQNFILIFI